MCEPKPQTLRAWEPWHFTRSILFELQTWDYDVDDSWKWRTRWIAGVACLRTIGHVLDKIDAKRSLMHRTLIEEAWKSWKKEPDDHRVFFNFIEKERNNILKEFSFGTEFQEYDEEPDPRCLEAYEDAAELFREAVYWWRAQLTEIENRLS